MQPESVGIQETKVIELYFHVATINHIAAGHPAPFMPFDPRRTGFDLETRNTYQIHFWEEMYEVVSQSTERQRI
ncbi:predicted protein [Sclerotinia sclerotiorum 1980 UF-70]|uniref:Uncharacterized protein n=1 Tax=Sclerotinia sclerotiorum (strain ATCC 18683 / 1980 / Ss-1) TaxID=665079 RepID=A7E6L2_SCLS1|nr:predicted protein [Sclerotinia sclerotiorum 1980 UF-70]EDN91534.1 predicted protein [Sclerotinia sclerotiorum 1980 UF-70]